MNAVEYYYLLNKPQAIGDKGKESIDNVVQEFPYFQSARSLQLKILYNQDNFRYKESLKRTAAYTTDRSVLFEFITNANFVGFQTHVHRQKLEAINNITVNSCQIVLPQQAEFHELISDKVISENVNKRTEAALAEEQENTKVISFDTNAKHSFQEWLQLSSYKPIVRSENTTVDNNTTESSAQKKAQIEIINKFIEANPKIKPTTKESTILLVSNQNSIDNSMLMTETLAKVYLDQKKYTKAIQAYEILILKYPEKSSFFADRISDIKIMQQNNN